jgi:HSP20 family protein
MPDKESPQTTQSTTQRQSGTEQGHAQGKQADGKSGQQREVPARRDGLMPSLWRENPLAFMHRLSAEMDRVFDAFGRSGGFFGSRFGRSGENGWSPEIELYERDNQLIVCADLPGMKKDDIHVEITDDALIIQGERQHEFSDTQGRYQRSERSYGSFYRTIPLPEGVDPEQMQASFQDGVLKVTMPLPQQQQQRRSRRIEIQESDTSQSRENLQSSKKSAPTTHSESSPNP